jgi:hypothetical protein
MLSKTLIEFAHVYKNQLWVCNLGMRSLHNLRLFMFAVKYRLADFDEI